MVFCCVWIADHLCVDQLQLSQSSVFGCDRGNLPVICRCIHGPDGRGRLPCRSDSTAERCHGKGTLPLGISFSDRWDVGSFRRVEFGKNHLLVASFGHCRCHLQHRDGFHGHLRNRPNFGCLIYLALNFTSLILARIIQIHKEVSNAAERGSRRKN